MSAYYLFDNITVKDPERLEEYKALAAPLVAAHGGRYVVLGGPTEVLEGTWSPVFPVVIAFDDVAAARGWYESEAYQQIKRIRHAAVDCNAVLIHGL